jgi:hypothetical protein
VSIWDSSPRGPNHTSHTGRPNRRNLMTNPPTPDTVTHADREIPRLAGAIHQHIYDELVKGLHPIRVGSDTLRMAYAEEAEPFGYDDDDPEIILRRESDGAFFEMDLEVIVRRLETPAAAAAASKGGHT